MKRRWCRLLVAGAAIWFAAGCATANGGTKESSTSQVQASPPEEEPSDEMPAGPPVKTRADLPPQAQPEEESSDETEGENGDAKPGREKTSAENEETSEKRHVVSESEIGDLLEMGPAYVFQAVELEPARTDGGKFRGFRIADASEKAREVMRPQMQIGDIVTHVNDVRLKRPDDYMKAWKKLPDTDEIEVEFLRDGNDREASWAVESSSRVR